MSIKASQQSLGRKVSPADLLLALLSPHQTILAIGMVGLEFGIDVVSKLLRSRKIDSLQVQMQKSYDVNSKIMVFVQNNQALTIT
jgi:hypothetical protein